MEYIELGSTKMKISRVGLGGIPIQRVDQKTANTIVDEMIIQGINFIDTARGYTTSEKQIGDAIYGRREKFYIATKTMARDKETMKKEVEISLANLQTDYIDLYQFHNISTEEELIRIMADDGAYKALEELKLQGIVKHIGITSHKVGIIEKAIDMDVFETIQYPYNTVESQGKDAIARAHAKGIGTIAMKPMAGGALKDGRLAMKYLLEDENLSVAIPGMESVEEVIQNAKAADGIQLTEIEKKQIKEEAEALGTHFCRRCQYCLPCPQGIDIPTCFIFEGYVSRYNLADWAGPRYEAMKAKADACVECGLCESRCPYGLPIKKMLKEVKKTFSSIK